MQKNKMSDDGIALLVTASSLLEEDSKTILNDDDCVAILEHFGDNMWVGEYLYSKGYDPNRRDVKNELQDVITKGLPKDQQEALSFPRTAIPFEMCELRRFAKNAISQKFGYFKMHYNRQTT
jgi:hypothetical protein